MIRLFAAALLSLAFATPALAEDTSKAVKPPKAPKICKPTEEATGTRMRPTKICKTQAQWDAQRGDASDDMDGAKMKGRTN